MTSVIDLPFSVSLVIAGLIFVSSCSAPTATSGRCCDQSGIQIIFAVPGIVLATIFVTLPFVARELIPVLRMPHIGPEEEEVSCTLGRRRRGRCSAMTLPNIGGGLLHGVLSCNARAIGEFGAVNVVSGKKTGQTDTLPILIEKLYQGMGATRGRQRRLRRGDAAGVSSLS